MAAISTIWHCSFNSDFPSSSDHAERSAKYLYVERVWKGCSHQHDMSSSSKPWQEKHREDKPVRQRGATVGHDVEMLEYGRWTHYFQIHSSCILYHDYILWVLFINSYTLLMTISVFCYIHSCIKCWIAHNIFIYRQIHLNVQHNMEWSSQYHLPMLPCTECY